MSSTSNTNEQKTNSIAVVPADNDLPGHTIVLGETVPLKLASGQYLGPFTVAYQTYGTLNS